MTGLPRHRAAVLERATAALFEAIDESLAAGQPTPCRGSSAYDADDLDATGAAELIHACRSECPVLQQCTVAAALQPRSTKVGTVIAGEYYPAGGKAPQWQELYDELRDLIETGHYAPGERLPSVDELARDTQLHRTVIHVALTNLERDGRIITDGAAGERRLVVEYGSFVGSRQLNLRDPDEPQDPRDDETDHAEPRRRREVA